MKGVRGKLSPPCPFCDGTESVVVDSRWHLPTMTKRRKRHCAACNEPFYTEEKALSVRIEKSSTRYSVKPKRAS
jgi:transcriptional regulator NrdR family protein